MKKSLTTIKRSTLITIYLYQRDIINLLKLPQTPEIKQEIAWKEQDLLEMYQGPWSEGSL